MKRNWKPILLAGVTFLLGVICGASITGGYAVHRVEQLLNSDTDQVVQLGSSYLARKLALDAAQKETFQPIADDVSRQLHALRVENAPTVRRIFEGGAAKLEPVLRPEQKQKLQALLTGPRKRWDRLSSNEVPATQEDR